MGGWGITAIPDEVVMFSGKKPITKEERANNYVQFGSVWAEKGLVSDLQETPEGSKITLKDGTTVQINDKTNVDPKTPMVISQSKDNTIKFTNFKGHDTDINGTDADNKYEFWNCNSINVNGGKGKDKITVINSNNVDVIMTDNGDTTRYTNSTGWVFGDDEYSLPPYEKNSYYEMKDDTIKQTIDNPLIENLNNIHL